MKKILPLIALAVLVFPACQTDSIKERELELKQKELELKEGELAQREANLNRTIAVNSNTANEASIKENNNPATNTKKESVKKLRYLFFSNGGLVGYFDDGTVAGCPRCDLIKENVESLKKSKPFGTYTVEKNYLLVNGNERVELYENGKPTRDLAIIDYKQIVDFDQ